MEIFMKAKNLMAVAVSLFFAACSDSNSPTTPNGILGPNGEVGYSSTEGGAPVPGSSGSSENPGNSQNPGGSTNPGGTANPGEANPPPPITDAPPVPSGKVNFPFPQMSDYGGRAVLLTDKATASTQLKSMFQAWMTDMYNEKGDIAGIRSNPGSEEYFSEGVGYGMLLMVYFSDNTTSYQPQFDKLWNFYKKFMNPHGLMIWKIGNLSESWDPGNGAALDGDIDAAAALIMAAYQFGDEKYLTEAVKLIQSMKNYEFESDGQHLPGDTWGAGVTRRNPGYFDPSYMPLFAVVDKANATFWSSTAYDANMKLYESSSNEVSTGLIDDWTNNFGKSEDDYYSYDASRAPWRNAKAVCWHGDTRALAIDKKMAAFVSTVPASSMSGPVIRSSGSLGSDHNSTFVTSLMTALISDAAYQSKLNEYWAEAVALGNENYFNQSLKLLNGLLVSGNMPNLMALAAGNN